MQLGINIWNLDLMAIGFVDDIFIESGNDTAKGAHKQLASQSDMDKFMSEI